MDESRRSVMTAQVDLYTRAIPNTITCLNLDLHGKGDEELTLNGEYKTDHPCASCYRHDYPLLVPNGEAGSTHERLIREDGRFARLRNKTYIRSTIKREEVETDRYPKI